MEISCSVEIRAIGTRRGVAFLTHASKTVNVTTAFEELGENTRRTFNTRFDHYSTGFDNPKWYHGWNKSQYEGAYQDCFVFKAQDDRLYGFLCHPSLIDRRYLLCVLVLHANKNDWATDISELKRAKAMVSDNQVADALKRLFQKETEQKK